VARALPTFEGLLGREGLAVGARALPTFEGLFALAAGADL